MKKYCPKCNSDKVDLLFSVSKLWCFNCREFFDFKLKPGKKSILIKGLVGEDRDHSSVK